LLNGRRRLIAGAERRPEFTFDAFLFARCCSSFFVAASLQLFKTASRRARAPQRFDATPANPACQSQLRAQRRVSTGGGNQLY